MSTLEPPNKAFNQALTISSTEESLEPESHQIRGVCELPQAFHKYGKTKYKTKSPQLLGIHPVIELPTK